MKIDQLIYFNEVAKEEHIGRAAKIIGISPSAISHSISSLEGELQIKLFQKKGKRIYLTEEGYRLLEKSNSLISQFINLKNELLSEKEDRSYFKICASHTLSSQFVTHAWLEAKSLYQNVTAELITLRSSDVIKSVLERKSDIGVCFSPNPHPDLEFTSIFSGELYINTRKGHPVRKIKRNKIQGLQNFQAILPKSYEGIQICIQHEMFKKFGVPINLACLIDSYDVSLEIIRNSNYWGFTPDIFLDLDHKDELIKPSQGWSAPYDISVFWRKNQFIPKFFHCFKEALKNQIMSFKK